MIFTRFTGLLRRVSAFTLSLNAATFLSWTSVRRKPISTPRNVTLAASAGSIHAVVGENGAGKSTLMRILAGCDRPDAGRILIAGEEQSFRRPADALCAGVAMVYQELSLAPHLTVAENVVLGHEPGHWGCFARRQANARVRDLADILLPLHEPAFANGDPIP